MHKAIKEDVIIIEIIRNIIDKITLMSFEQPDISRLSQLICSGLLRFVDWISKLFFPINKFLSDGGVVQHLFIE